MSASIASASSLGVVALVAPERADVGDAEPLGTPNSVTITAWSPW